MYDSTEDTQKHIHYVRTFLRQIIIELEKRFNLHDSTKLEDPEKKMYDEFTPKLRELTYGSDEYKECLKKMGYALRHHYEHNSHHPEHYKNGVSGMNLLDIIEMLADWRAAVLRHPDGDVWESLEINQGRFGIDDQLYQIIKNTFKELGW